MVRIPAVVALCLLFIGSLATPAFSGIHSPDTVPVYASGLMNPFGLAVDGRGWLWVAEAGTGAANGRISIVTPDGQVHPFLTPLPSAIVEGNPIGPTRIIFDVNGKMLINQGDGSDPLSEAVLTVDTTGFIPGSVPLTPAAIESVYAIEPFVLGQGYPDSNPYSISLGPDNDLFVVDAGANLIVRRTRATGALSIFSTFPNIGTRQSVPTSIRFAGDRFYVGNLTGFPFTPGTASVFEVSPAGTVSTLQTGFTMIVDIDFDPRDGRLVVLQYARFGVGGFQPNLGGVFKLIPGGGVDTIATGLNLPTGMRFRSDGQLFVTTRTNGQILRVSFPPTSRIRLDPTTAAYGNLLVSTADTAVLHIQNISSSPLQVNSISVSGADFSLLNVPALPVSVSSGTSLDIRAVFQPTAAGVRTGAISVTSDDPLYPVVEAVVTGKGISAIAHAQAGVLYATASGPAGGVLRTIDQGTGAMGALGAFGVPEIRSLTVRTSTTELYGAATSPTGSTLYRISADSGAAVRAARIPLGDIRAIAFSAGDTLYGATGSGRLYRFNPVTGDTVFVGATPGLQYSGLAFSPTSGRLWAVVRPPADTVYTINPATGAATIVGATGFSALNTSIAFAPSGVPYVLIDAGSGQNYLATLDTTDASGDLAVANPLSVANILGIAMQTDSLVTSVGERGEGEVPQSFVLEQNYPNPFNPVTTITFALPNQDGGVGTRHARPSDMVGRAVSLHVVDVLGRHVATLVDDSRAPGVYSVAWDASNLASGTYIYRLTAGGFTATRRMMLVK